ncbi:sporulation integral membrane protein YlbJ [Brevibacillus sp. SYP-B805]|uniref:sporulation integral membrane protein YlbJ n=1 Tax=Brevibacillus sp. SYP-B805 TaxID=1578199 RepID=UPI0013EB3DFC|nr:sporulation integral membrane protein YlbJ [Brevibacillus sp. SYP-B805]NGQ93877.1 sporulation integral membrane protein YlbJ [Brevibacillus sp. SYP-B805]
MTRRSPLLTLLLALFSIGLVITLVSHPEISFRAAIKGLDIWWEVVFPALLPFIVVSEILMGVGVVHFVGVLLEPLMRPLFNVPGTGGFVLTMGFSSGYPVAAKLTTRLRENGSLTRAEGERLVSFATTGDPLFVIGAVAVGFFHSEELGFVLAVTHYLSALLLGIVYRFHAAFDPSSKKLPNNQLPLAIRALQAMHRARIRDGRPFGKLMGEAVQSALQMQLMIGGFLVVFSVVIQLLSAIHVTRFLSGALSVLLGPLGLPTAFAKALVAGTFEVTLGAQAVSEMPNDIPLIWKAAIASALVSWGGFSVHAQVASILSQTDIRVTPYLFARALHAVLALLSTFVLWQPLTMLAAGITDSVPVFSAQELASPTAHWWHLFGQSWITALGLGALCFLVRMLVVGTWRKSYR